MPQYGQRTNPFYPDTGQDVPPQELGGMAYNPYSSGTDWGFALRNTLNNLLAHKQGQAAMAQEEEERQKKELQTAFENQIKLRKLAVEERPPEPTPLRAKFEAIRVANPDKPEGWAWNRAVGIETPEEVTTRKREEFRTHIKEYRVEKRIERRFAKPEKPEKPDAGERKEKYVRNAVAKGWMTDKEGAMALIGISQNNVSVAKTAAARRVNEGLAVKSFDDYFNSAGIDGDVKKLNKRLRQTIKDNGGTHPFSSEGYPMDMPIKYVTSMLHLEDEVADANDQDTKDLYDEMYKTFKEQILPSYRSFNDFMAAKDPEKDQLALFLKKDPLFDKNQLKRWFELYAEE